MIKMILLCDRRIIMYIMCNRDAPVYIIYCIAYTSHGHIVRILSVLLIGFMIVFS